MKRRVLLVYPVWIAVCATLFVALSGVDDPSRRSDRILTTDAARRAEAVLSHDPRWAGHRAVHVAFARAGEGAPERRWIVLCDDDPHTSLGSAVVVELRASDGTLLRVRRPR